MRDSTRLPATFFVLLLAIGAETGAQHAYRLSAPLERAPVGKVRDARASADGRRCLYRAEPRGDGLMSLYRAATDGSEPVVELGRTASGPGQYELDADGEHVLHLVREPGTGLRRLVGRRGDGTGGEVVLDGGFGEVLDFHLAPAGDLVLFRATTASNEAELFAAPTRGGRVFRVNGPLSADGAVESDYVLGPDGRSVYYRQTLAPGTVELFRGSVVSRTPRRLCAPHAAGSAVLEFVVSGDQARVVFRADSRANNVLELFVAPADGTAVPVRVGPDLPVNADVREFALSADGNRIVFRADGGTSSKVELYSAPNDGLSFTRLNQDLGTAADVFDFQVTPDSAAVVFRANVDGVANQELFLAPIDGSSPARRLGPDLPSPQSVRGDYLLRGGKVLYGVDPGAGWQVHVLALDAGAQPVPFGPLAAGPRALFATSTHFLAMSDAGLLSVPIDLSSTPILLDVPNPVLLNPLLTDPIEPGGLLLFPRTTRFDAVGDVVETTELRSVPADASQPSIVLSAPFPKRAIVESVSSATPSADGKYVAYTARGPVERAYAVPSQGTGEPVLLSTSLTDYGSPAFTHDSARLVLCDEDGFCVQSADGSGPRQCLVPDGESFLLAERAPMALVRTSTAAGPGLLAVRLDGSAPVDLGAGLPVGASVQEWLITADGSWAAMVAVNHPVSSVYRAPTDGSSPPELVSGAGGWLSPSPDGTTLSFFEGRELYRTTFAVGVPSSLVHSFAPPSRYDPLVFAFDPDGNDIVVFEAGDLLLYPASGSVRHLNVAHPGAALMQSLELTGSRALYITAVDDQGNSLTYDLWSVPLDGSAPAVRINTDPAGLAYRVFQSSFVQATQDTTPDGNHVVFASDGRLMVGRLDGSQPPAVLVDDPSRFQYPLSESDFTADSQTFVYRRGGLFSVPLTGLRPPRQLDAPDLDDVGRADWFRIMGGRRGVLFLARPDGDAPYELFLGVLDRAVRGVPR